MRTPTLSRVLRSCLAPGVASLLLVPLACSDDNPKTDGTDDDAGAGGEPADGSGGKTGSGGTAGTGGTGGGTSTGGTGGGTSTGGTGGDKSTGGAGGKGGAPNTGGADAGTCSRDGGIGDGGSDDTPILARPAQLTHDCTVTRPMTQLGLNPWAGYDLVAGGTTAYLPRVDGDYGQSLTWSSVDPDGSLGTPVPVETTEDYFYGLAAAPGADRFTLVWALNDGQTGKTQIQLAQVDADGEKVLEPRNLLASADNQQPPLVAPAGSGYLVFWAEQNDQGGSRLRIARLSAAGAVEGTAKTVDVLEQGYLAVSALTATPTGAMVTYTAGQGDWNTRLRALDADLDPVGELVDLGASWFVDTSDLIVRGDHVVASWSELGGTQGANSAIIKLGRFGFDGARIGQAHSLQAPLVDEENVMTHFVDYGDDIGLLWAKGGIIYICAGCVPDDHVEFVLLDGCDFTPHSEVVKLEYSASRGGLYTPKGFRRGDDLLVTASITYHVSSEGASALLTCTPK